MLNRLSNGKPAHSEDARDEIPSTGKEPRAGNAFYVPWEEAANGKGRKKGGGATSMSNNHGINKS